MPTTFIPSDLQDRFQDFVAHKFGVEWTPPRADGERRVMVAGRLLLVRRGGSDAEIFCGDEGMLKLLQDDFAAALAAELNETEAQNDGG